MALLFFQIALLLHQDPDSLTTTHTGNYVSTGGWVLLAVFALFIGWLVYDAISKQHHSAGQQTPPQSDPAQTTGYSPVSQSVPKPVKTTTIPVAGTITKPISTSVPSQTPKPSSPIEPVKEVTPVIQLPVAKTTGSAIQTSQKLDNAQSKPLKTEAVSHQKPVGIQPKIQEELDKESEITFISFPESFLEQVTAQFIGYSPVTDFEQLGIQTYPTVVVPKPGCVVKFPKKGRFSNRGYTEAAFKVHLKKYFGAQFDIHTEHHLLVSNSSNPYEPDFSMIDRKSGLNMCIDVEIDEPYSGLSRRAMHCQGDDVLRNAFFSDRGWIVVRFAEIQIHQNPIACCHYLADVIQRMHPTFRIVGLEPATPIEVVESWSSLQAQQWSAVKYRERYLGISGFSNVSNLLTKVILEESEADRRAEDKVISSVKVQVLTEKPKHWNITNSHSRDKRLTFDEDQHQYWIDKNPNTIAVSTLVKRMFPEFDEEHWAARKAPQLGMTKQAVLDMWHANGEESRQSGTKLHTEIESFFENGNVVATKEFGQFQQFIADNSGLKPFRTEWRIFDDHYMVAGTVDMVVKNDTGGYDLYDWKRTKEIKTDGWGKYGFGPLSHLDDCNATHYSLQLNFYRWILKAYYDLEIDSMYLVAMHPNFSAYKKIEILNMEQDIEALLESTLVKC